MISNKANVKVLVRNNNDDDQDGQPPDEPPPKTNKIPWPPPKQKSKTDQSDADEGDEPQRLKDEELKKDGPGKNKDSDQNKGKGKGGGKEKSEKRIEEIDMGGDDMLLPGQEPKEEDIIEGTPNKKTPDLEKANDEAKNRLEDEKRKTPTGNQGRGLGGHNLRDIVQDMVTPGVDWKTILKDLVRRISADTTWSKPHKRHLANKIYLPRTSTVETIRNIAVCIDTSGSITNEILSQFVAELKNLIDQFKNIKFTIVLWSEEPYYHTMMDKNNKNKILDILKQNAYMGGNSWNNFWEYFTKYNIDKNLAGIVHLTDGGLFGRPPVNKIPKNVKVLFLVNNREGVNFLIKEMGPVPPTWKVFRVKFD